MATATIVSTKHVPVRVVDRRDHTAELWSIRVAHELTEFTFRPGQYATLGIERDGKVLERPYSIVSSPTEPHIEFLLELVPEGVLTPSLHALGVGDQLLMRPRAKGLFRLDLDGGRTHHLMFCTVTGVAPFVSMVRHLREDGRPLPDGLSVVMVHGGSRSSEFGYDAELEALDAELPWFHYRPTISRPWEDPEWTGELGRVEDVMRKHADAHGATPQNAIVYLCGHPGMITVGESIFHRAGFARKTVRQEEYWPLGKEPLKQDEALQAAEQHGG